MPSAEEHADTSPLLSQDKKEKYTAMSMVCSQYKSTLPAIT
jgi:hypothetical protein